MTWPISTEQRVLDSEKDAANEFLKKRNLPLVESIEFVDEEDCSYLKVNNGQYYIDVRSEQVEMRNIRGSFMTPINYLCAHYIDEPMDPEEAGGRREIYEDAYFGSLSSFLVRIALETVYHEWQNRGY